MDIQSTTQRGPKGGRVIAQPHPTVITRALLEDSAHRHADSGQAIRHHPSSVATGSAQSASVRGSYALNVRKPPMLNIFGDGLGSGRPPSYDPATMNPEAFLAGIDIPFGYLTYPFTAISRRHVSSAQHWGGSFVNKYPRFFSTDGTPTIVATDAEFGDIPSLPDPPGLLPMGDCRVVHTSSDIPSFFPLFPNPLSVEDSRGLEGLPVFHMMTASSNQCQVEMRFIYDAAPTSPFGSTYVDHSIYSNLTLYPDPTLTDHEIDYFNLYQSNAIIGDSGSPYFAIDKDGTAIYIRGMSGNIPMGQRPDAVYHENVQHNCDMATDRAGSTDYAQLSTYDLDGRSWEEFRFDSIAYLKGRINNRRTTRVTMWGSDHMVPGRKGNSINLCLDGITYNSVANPTPDKWLAGAEAAGTYQGFLMRNTGHGGDGFHFRFQVKGTGTLGHFLGPGPPTRWSQGYVGTNEMDPDEWTEVEIFDEEGSTTCGGNDTHDYFSTTVLTVFGNVTDLKIESQDCGLVAWEDSEFTLPERHDILSGFGEGNPVNSRGDLTLASRFYEFPSGPNEPILWEIVGDTVRSNAVSARQQIRVHSLTRTSNPYWMQFLSDRDWIFNIDITAIHTATPGSRLRFGISTSDAQAEVDARGEAKLYLVDIPVEEMVIGSNQRAFRYPDYDTVAAAMYVLDTIRPESFLEFDAGCDIEFSGIQTHQDKIGAGDIPADAIGEPESIGDRAFINNLEDGYLLAPA